MSTTLSTTEASTNDIDRVQSPVADSISSLSSFSSADLDSFALEENMSSPVASPEVTVAGVNKHERWFFEDAMVKLLIDDTLYNIPHTLLTRHSEWFRERFTQPPECLPPGWKIVSTAGVNLFVNHDLGVVQERRPGAIRAECMPDVFHLYGATSFEFDVLLSVLCPDHFGVGFTKEQWNAVLKLATLWHFPSLRTLAIKHLDPLLSFTPFERLIAARDHGVVEWSDRALHDLIERDEPLRETEVALMTPADVVRVFRGYALRMQARTVDDLRADPVFSATFQAQDSDVAEAARRAKAEIGHEEDEREAAEAAVRKMTGEVQENTDRMAEEEQARFEVDAVSAREEMECRAEEENCCDETQDTKPRQTIAEGTPKKKVSKKAAKIAERRERRERIAREEAQRKLKAEEAKRNAREAENREAIAEARRREEEARHTWESARADDYYYEDDDYDY